jgi:hypothetical protein
MRLSHSSQGQLKLSEGIRVKQKQGMSLCAPRKILPVTAPNLLLLASSKLIHPSVKSSSDNSPSLSSSKTREVNYSFVFAGCERSRLFSQLLTAAVLRGSNNLHS